MIDFYILNEHGVPQHEPDMMKAMDFWLQRENKIVAKTPVGDCEVSTVFLTYDHSFDPEPHLPILWETMVFGGPLDQEMWRCGGTKEQAEAQHERVVALVEKEMLFEQRNEGKDDEQSS